MREKLHETQEKYKEKFGEYFPLIGFLYLSDADMIKMIEKHIESNEKYRDDLPEGTLI